MNMKLLAGLAVAITLASAMAFVGLSTKTSQSSATPVDSTSQVLAPKPLVQKGPNPEASSGTASVTASVKAGGDQVKTSVTVK